MAIKRLRPIDILVTPGATMTVVIPPIDLNDRTDILIDTRFLTDPIMDTLDTSEGTEVVSIQVGATGTVYPLYTARANIFYGDRFHKDYDYFVGFGTNGPPAAVLHFINFNTPRRARPYNPGNAGTPGDLTGDTPA